MKFWTRGPGSQVLWWLQPESGSRGFLFSLTHSFFRADRSGGFRKSLGRTGSHPADTCPGRTAAGLGFDSCEGGLGRFLPCIFLGRGWRRPPLLSPPPRHSSSSLKLSAALFLFGPAPTLWRLKVKPDALRRVLKARRGEPSCL